MDQNNEVVCCFCGLGLKIQEAVLLVVYPVYNNDESQQLYCHREHLKEKLIESIPLHPDL
ncbi:hypothetical protein GCM10027049_26900 [Mucilaginibacter puniceus]